MDRSSNTEERRTSIFRPVAEAISGIASLRSRQLGYSEVKNKLRVIGSSRLRAHLEGSSEPGPLSPARRMFPGLKPLIERVRNTKNGRTRQMARLGFSF